MYLDYRWKDTMTHCTDIIELCFLIDTGNANK